MAIDMSDDERRAFLSAGTRTAKLAVTRSNGAPHVVPIWFVLDGDDVDLHHRRGHDQGQVDPPRRARRAVRRRRQPAVLVRHRSKAPRASADDLDEMLVWATRLGARYMGADRAEQFGRRNAVPEELLVRVTPTKIVAKARVSD